jgi:hypothetical protein
VVGLDGNELGALLVAAGLGGPGGHALISLLVLKGQRGTSVVPATPIRMDLRSVVLRLSR